jgi:hypothetical protein
MNYIAETLGIKVTAKAWERAAHLPFYLTKAYTFQVERLSTQLCQLCVHNLLKYSFWWNNG